MMSARENNLKTVQNWMQAVITHPEGVEAGVAGQESQRILAVPINEIESVITRSKARTSVERLSVYSNAYYARLIECLEVEFPALSYAVGEDVFAAFVVGYLQSFPSTSYTLNDLGQQFPQHLVDSRPPREDSNPEPDWADFLADVARLERLYSQVFDGPGEEESEKLTIDRLKKIPPTDWPQLIFVTAPSLALISLRFPVHEYISAVRKAEEPSIPAPQPTFLAVNRRDYVVRRRQVNETQFGLLKHICDGHSLGDAIEYLMRTDPSDIEQLAANLQQWFAVWTREGFFLDVKVGESSAPDMTE